MKTLGKLKLWGMAALMLVGMSACLNTNGPDFGFGVSAYILQSGSGENATFKPQFQITGNEPISQAYAVQGSMKYFFTHITGSNNYSMELSPYFSATDSLPKGTFTITAVNAEGETALQQISFDTDKKLGEIALSSFTYDGTSGRITAKWNKTENATSYYVVYKVNTDMWIPYNRLNTEENGNEMSATFSLLLEKDERYSISIAAFNQGVLKVAGSVPVVGGQNTSLDKPEEME